MSGVGTVHRAKIIRERYPYISCLDLKKHCQIGDLPSCLRVSSLQFLNVTTVFSYEAKQFVPQNKIILQTLLTSLLPRYYKLEILQKP